MFAKSVSEVAFRLIAKFSAICVCSGGLLLAMGFLTFADDSATSATSSSRTLVFPNGNSGYEGASDSEIWALAPTTILESNPNASSDANNDGGESQVLLSFESIVGTSELAIPENKSNVTLFVPLPFIPACR